MIPPLLMDVEPHHRVGCERCTLLTYQCLDLCAAPGSKTAQIIEALNPHHTESTGMLIANDADYKRTHMLVHQTGRMPSKGLVVTNFDASELLMFNQTPRSSRRSHVPQHQPRQRRDPQV